MEDLRRGDGLGHAPDPELCRRIERRRPVGRPNGSGPASAATDDDRGGEARGLEVAGALREDGRQGGCDVRG